MAIKKPSKSKTKNSQSVIVNFLYEIGTLRKTARAHRQTLLTDDLSDNIASHSYRTAMIAWFLAREENADPYKTVMMALLHDTPEIRSNDHNWVHKKYVKIYDDEIIAEQLGSLPHKELYEFSQEYTARISKEAILAKEADVLDQILLLREYEWAGNKEAHIWLYGKNKDIGNTQLKKLKTKTGIHLGKAMYDIDPSEWWGDLFTSKNR
jgi:putative hydrolase of HD superfamily